MVEVKCLSDDELQNELHKLGFPPGPILPSTRKVYEKKLVQLLVSTPCAPPKKNGPGELNRAQDNDDSEEFNATIILKRNITPSSEKSKGPKNEIDVVQVPNSSCRDVLAGNSAPSDVKLLCQAQLLPSAETLPGYHYTAAENILFKNRCKTSTSKPKAVEIFCSDSKRTEGRRCAARTSNIRCKALRNLKEKACCRVNRRAGDSDLETFPMGLTLAVFGILVIVIFVYITMESKSLFG